MPTSELKLPIYPRHRAPNFTLPLVGRDEMVSLSDYRDKTAVLIGLFRGVYCPLCRRKIAEMGSIRDKLLDQGIDSLAIVASKLEHACLYFRTHPARVTLAADPEMSLFRSYSVPKPAVTPEMLEKFHSTFVNPFRDLPEPVPVTAIAAELNQLDGYEMNETDLQELNQQWRWDGTTQLTARFLIDRQGLIRWTDIEGGGQGMKAVGLLATDAELFTAVRAL